MTSALDDDVPAYRLYTSEQAAELVGGGQDDKITGATFDNLARSGQVKYTRIGRKIRWTLAQITAAVACCETCGGEGAKVSAPTARERTAPVQRAAVAPFEVRPGSRYAASSR